MIKRTYEQDCAKCSRIIDRVYPTYGSLNRGTDTKSLRLRRRFYRIQARMCLRHDRADEYYLYNKTARNLR